MKDKSEKEEKMEVTLTKAQQQMVYEGNSFSISLFDKLFEKMDSSAFFSPLSVSAGCAMLANGAQGETRKRICDAIGLGNHSLTEVNKYYKELVSQLYLVDEQTEFSLASGVWIDNKMSIKNDFRSAVKTYYDATAKNIDCSSQSALNEINAWASEKTHGMIPKLLEKIEGEVILANSIYFKGGWEKQFDKANTGNGIFYGFGGEKTESFMKMSDRGISHYVDEDLTFCELYYGNRSYSMVLLMMPDIKGFVRSFDEKRWADIMNHSRMEHIVNLKMPKFEIYSDMDLLGCLESLGVELQCGDFTGIADKGISFESVKQKARIEVDEQGTKAAASLAMQAASYLNQPLAEIDITFDHPFIFVIRETGTGAILFMGAKVK